MSTTTASAAMSTAPPTPPTKTECRNHSSHMDDPFDPREKDDPSVENVSNLRISRGERPEATIDWDRLETLYVLDEMENKIRFTDIFKKQKTIIIFVRHFLDFISKEYVEDIAIIPLEYLQNADVRLVVIGPALSKFIKPFKTLTGLIHTLYVDPDREVYKALGCLEKMAAGELSSSKHIKSGVISGIASSVWRAMRQSRREFQGDPKQQGGAFIFGPGNVCHFNHIDQSSTDHCQLNDLLTKAGITNVSFPKDPRVQQI